ncbi:hypothetical protein EMIT0P201_10162 [Pseudomonas chlororaphis]
MLQYGEQTDRCQYKLQPTYHSHAPPSQQHSTLPRTLIHMLLQRIQETVDHPTLVVLHFHHHPVPDTRFLLKHYLTQSTENKIVHGPYIRKFLWVLVENP